MAKANKPTKPPHGGDPVNNLPAPTGLVVSVISSIQANLSWDPTPNATTYRVNRDQYVPAIITQTSYSDASLKAGTAYTYWITAVIGGQLSPKSNLVTITTPN